MVMSSFQETNRGSLAFGVPLGQHVEQRIGQVGELLGGLGGGLVAQRATARTSAPRRRRGRARAAAARRSPNRSSSCTRPTARCVRAPGRWPRPPRPPRPPGAAWCRARPSRASGQTRRASRTSPRPCAREACRRRGSRCAGVGFAVGVRRRTGCRRAPRPPPTRSPGRGCGSGGAGMPAASRGRRTRPSVTASSTPPECTCPPVGSRESDSVSSVARFVIRTRKYRCAIGSSAAGCSCHTSPSMRTVNVSGSTSMLRQRVVERHVGLADLADIVDRDQAAVDRQPVGQAVLDRPAGDTKCTEVAAAAAGAAPNIGRGSTGCGVGMDAFASPIAAQAIMPPLITACGRTPKNAGSHSTRSASLPTSTEPTSWSSPCAIGRADGVLRDVAAGPVVVGARRRPRSAPRRRFITCAVCQVRITTSPMRPIAWASLPIIEMAPMSCSRSSAAIVDGRIRLSANARSSGTLGFR